MAKDSGRGAGSNRESLGMDFFSLIQKLNDEKRFNPLNLAFIHNFLSRKYHASDKSSIFAHLLKSEIEQEFRQVHEEYFSSQATKLRQELIEDDSLLNSIEEILIKTTSLFFDKKKLKKKIQKLKKKHFQISRG